MTGSTSWRRGSVWAAAGVLLLAGVVLVVLGFRGHDHPLAGPDPSAAAIHAAVHAADDGAPVPGALSTARSVPVTLRIPALSMSVPLLTAGLGLNADGSVQVPAGTVQPGWFRLGPAPGQIGSAIILGHVDSYQGPGVFFGLRTLAAGDQIFVDLSDGETATFTVNLVAQYSKVSFPSTRVYGSDGSSALQLVTCGGVFDHSTGHYLSNIVVYSSLSAVSPTVPPPAAAT